MEFISRTSVAIKYIINNSHFFSSYYDRIPNTVLLNLPPPPLADNRGYPVEDAKFPAGGGGSKVSENLYE